MQKKSFINNVFQTGFTQFIILFIGLLILRLLAKHVPEEGMGAYLIIRRFVGLVFPFTTLNLSISIARNIQYHKERAVEYLNVSIFILTILIAVLLTGLLISGDNFTKLLFGNADYRKLTFPVIFLLYVSSLQPLFAGYFRGRQKFTIMNVSNLIFWCIQIAVLLLTLYIDNWSMLLQRFLLIASGLILLSLLLQYILFVDEKKITIHKIQISRYKNFLFYGIVRLPNGLFLAGIFFIPVFITTRTISLSSAAYIGIIVSLLRIIYQIGTPFNMIILPKFSEYDSGNHDESISKGAQLIVKFVFTYALLFGAFMYLFSREIILLWFGENYLIVIPYLSIVVPSGGFLICYVLFRGVIDGLYVRPYTIYITMFGFIIVLTGSIISSFFENQLLGYTVSFAGGMYVLGVVSLLIIHFKLGIRLFDKKNIYALLWNVLMFIIVVQINRFSTGGILTSLIFKMVVASFIFAGSYYYYIYVGFRELRIKHLRFMGD